MLHPSILTILAVLVGLAACDPAGPMFDQEPPAPTAGDRDHSAVADPVLLTLAPGETADVAELSLTFVAVTEDSRCPVDVACFWEGYALVHVDAVVGTAEQRLTLGTLDLPNGVSRSATVEGYRITLTGLEPAPVSDAPTPPEAYRLMLEVEPT
ncbi:MAG: hypothetical protein R3314_04400 [Longimicrobiales bacterium]|nr:hypothetical protein [Longimicrobiales bacterium]